MFSLHISSLLFSSHTSGVIVPSATYSPFPRKGRSAISRLVCTVINLYLNEHYLKRITMKNVFLSYFWSSVLDSSRVRVVDGLWGPSSSSSSDKNHKQEQSSLIQLKAVSSSGSCVHSERAQIRRARNFPSSTAHPFPFPVERLGTKEEQATG